LVPLFAGDLTGFAANTEAGIGKEAHGRLFWWRRLFFQE
jgi:hypothetical protein